MFLFQWVCGNNGILSQARTGASKYKEAEILESIQLSYVSAISKTGGVDKDGCLKDSIEDELKSIYTDGNVSVSVAQDGDGYDIMIYSVKYTIKSNGMVLVGGKSIASNVESGSSSSSSSLSELQATIAELQADIEDMKTNVVPTVTALSTTVSQLSSSQFTLDSVYPVR